MARGRKEGSLYVRQGTISKGRLMLPMTTQAWSYGIGDTTHEREGIANSRPKGTTLPHQR